MSKKDITIVASLCYRWGYSSKLQGVKDTLVPKLNEKYNVKFVEDPIKPGRGEYFVFLQKDGDRKIIFSNDESNKEDFTVIGGKLSGENVNDVVSAVDKLV